MRTERMRLAGPLLLTPEALGDERGFFLETYREADLPGLGIPDHFVQENHSRSRLGTIRGLHYQVGPGQAKLVRVARGSIWDVVVDVRQSSSTYGQWEAVTLDDMAHRMLYVPVGFAHGFCVTSEVADVIYLVSAYYDRGLERAVAWDDPELSISWPAVDPVLSERDLRNPSLASQASHQLRDGSN